MRKNILTTIIAFVSMGTIAMAQTPAASDAQPADPNAPAFTWSSDVFDFGNIPQGNPVTATFEFSNTGKQPLIITDVQKTCGCTSTKWPEKPVMPGEKATITAEYNAASEGSFTKAITVQSNAATPVVKLTFKGTVVKGAPEGVPEQKTIFNSSN